MARRLRDLVPDARVAVAHGQMGEEALEKVMVGFWEKEFDVLVCTTIVERPSCDVDSMWRTPSTVFTASSMRFDTWVSTSSGAAPRNVVVIVTIGNSIFGNRSTPREL